VPGLSWLPEGAAIDQETAVLKLPVPATVATNCTWLPIVAVAGVTVIEVTTGPVGITGPVELLPPPPQAVNARPIPASTAISPYQHSFLIEPKIPRLCKRSQPMIA
jgi:hypothetical protein